MSVSGQTLVTFIFNQTAIFVTLEACVNNNGNAKGSAA